MTSPRSQPPRPASALALRDALATGRLSPSDLAETCIARIEDREGQIGAFTWFDADDVRRQARGLEHQLAAGHPPGPLFGLPVALKDVIDTAGIPTENGAAEDAGRIPRRDAVIVERLRGAGAVILGKTVTTELAYLSPGKTRNPHNPAHTPGGSSSGSAAAVADGMAPLAVGTQTGGSVIRPAAFCGVTGYKPTFGLVPRDGVLMQSHSLDTVGVFAADPASAALLAETLIGEGAPGICPLLPPPPENGHPTRKPVFALVRPPSWDMATHDTRLAFDMLEAQLAPSVFTADLPEAFDRAAEQRARINAAEMAHHFRRYDIDRLGHETRAAIRDGQGLSATDYLEARAFQRDLAGSLEGLFARCDAILCPAAPGPAPDGLASTGDSIFNGLWTMAGTPAVTLPLFFTASGLPLGVQLAGPRHGDRGLLAAAHWLFDWAGGNSVTERGPGLLPLPA